jgi:hypothetical protein
MIKMSIIYCIRRFKVLQKKEALVKGIRLREGSRTKR